MQGTLVRYKTAPESAEENQQLIENVFAELRATSPEGIRYVVLRLADGSFVHFKEGPGSLQELEAFRAFQKGVKARCIEAPQAGEATVIGNYRMLRD
jgi:hypothetical protein